MPLRRDIKRFEERAGILVAMDLGKLWDRYGEAAWMGPWKEVYARPT